jgi:hypothetical protein
MEFNLKILYITELVKLQDILGVYARTMLEWVLNK